MVVGRLQDEMVKHENSGSCLKHPLEGGAVVTDGCERAKRLTL